MQLELVGVWLIPWCFLFLFACWEEIVMESLRGRNADREAEETVGVLLDFCTFRLFRQVQKHHFRDHVLRHCGSQYNAGVTCAIALSAIFGIPASNFVL